MPWLPETDLDAVVAQGPLELDPEDLEAVRSEPGGEEELPELIPETCRR